MSLFVSSREYFLNIKALKDKESTTIEAANFKSVLFHKEKQLRLALKESSEKLFDDCWFVFLDDLIPLLLEDDTKVAGYDMIKKLATKLDPDILLGEIMDKLICFEWPNDMNLDEYTKAVTLFMAYVELFGNSLEQLTRPKEWMLYFPFFTNFLKKTMNVVESLLTEKSSLSNRSQTYSDWDQMVFWITSAVLDFAHFIHAVTVSQKVAEFPINSVDIGSESGDTKRRYLGYFIQNLVFEKVVLNFDMQLSVLYFKAEHSKYNTGRADELEENASYKNYACKLVDRCIELSEAYGFTYERMFRLLNCLKQNQDLETLTIEDEIYENEKQMVNQRLYILSYEGIASLMALSLYRKKKCQSDMFDIAKNYIGISMNLLLGSFDAINHIDKGIFVLLVFSDNISANVTMDDIEKKINSPLGCEASFPVSRILQILSAVASMCPNPSIRFFSYHLIQRFLDFGDKEARLFFLLELLDRCPFPSMKTAAIGLLKDQVNQSFNSEEVSVFKTPVIVHTFFPIIFQFKPSWQKKQSEFWDDYGYIAQSLSFYYYLILKDQRHNWTSVWSAENIGSIKENYLKPIQEMIKKASAIPSNQEPPRINQQQLLKDSLDMILNKLAHP
ncbi:hypothetical protein BY458DRAFT_512206 [Sporodiniella umbellata]|nr:hypothetical protein BY458DRAFT_512206 [Sporodiniella umbellata]